MGRPLEARSWPEGAGSPLLIHGASCKPSSTDCCSGSTAVAWVHRLSTFVRDHRRESVRSRQVDRLAQCLSLQHKLAGMGKQPHGGLCCPVPHLDSGARSMEFLPDPPTHAEDVRRDRWEGTFPSQAHPRLSTRSLITVAGPCSCQCI